MTATGDPLGRWLWLPAVLVGGAGGAAAAGWLLLAAAQPRDGLAPWLVGLVAPHVAGAALAGWAGRRRVVAGLAGLAGSGLMTLLSGLCLLAWLGETARPGDDDGTAMLALGRLMVGGFGYAVLTLTACVVLVLVAFAEPPAGEG